MAIEYHHATEISLAGTTFPSEGDRNLYNYTNQCLFLIAINTYFVMTYNYNAPCYKLLYACCI